MKKITTLIIVLCMYTALQAQNVGIGTLTPNASAKLEVNATDKGLLIPNIALTSITDVVTITTPATSLLIFNTNITLPQGRGYYFWSGTAWIKLLIANDITSLGYWSLNGNSGTNASNFLGTTDNIPLNIRVNNQKAGTVDHILQNTFLGYFTGNANTTGINNTAIGNTAFNQILQASIMRRTVRLLYLIIQLETIIQPMVQKRCITILQAIKIPPQVQVHWI